mmetsp:Transcript_2044/g.2561  ORF Transcript_2044/g.2561 Transcript_2044/m.2561 type:complete len:226 (+) Transcript_2044:57-734(+)
MMSKLVGIIAVFVAGINAQDPANSWLGYAKGVNPANTGIITMMEAYWKVPSKPKYTGCRFTPWFGIETSDNLNLIQPVNPFESGHWDIYNEYYQWSPSHDTSSKRHEVSPGDIIYGKVTLNNAKTSYDMYVSDLNDGWYGTLNIPIQSSKTGGLKSYTISYIVWEHPCGSCADYPQDNEMLFYNISVYYDYKKVSPKWSTGYVENKCDSRAKIVNETAILLTWNS